MERVVCLAIGYVFGLFQTAFIYGKMNGIDIREHGSGNAGTTNALRTLGWKAGVITFIGDCIKCVVAVLLVRLLFAQHENVQLLAIYAGLGTVLGHNYPFYLKFKGGKGFASFLGMSLGIHWKYFIVIGICIIVITLVTKYIVLATMATVISYPIYLFYDTRNWIIFAVVTALSLIIIFKHYKNLVRIAKGEEFKFKI